LKQTAAVSDLRVVSLFGPHFLCMGRESKYLRINKLRMLIFGSVFETGPAVKSRLSNDDSL
jgi:hypothetical protein